MSDAPSADRGPLRATLRLLTLALGAANTGAAMLAESMNEDGIHYLDQGDAWVRGDWNVAVNGTWSPLYSAILGVAMRVVRPPIAWEFPLVQVVNFAVFLLALVSFEYFWRQVMARYYASGPQGIPQPDRLPRWALVVIGYGLFIWSTTSLIRLFAVTPDMLVAASVFAAGGVLLRLASGDWDGRTMAAFGGVLGMGYLAKAAMFPLSLAAFVIAALLVVRSGRAFRRLIPALASFVLVAGPFLTALSVKAGRFTFGDVGRVSYLKHVQHAPFPHYEPGSAGVTGQPLHPVTKSATTPTVYSYGGPEGVTFPLAYDQGYWYAGLRPRFEPRLQLQAFALNVQKYFSLFVGMQGILIGMVLVVAFTGRVHRPWLPGAWAIVAWAIAALGMYSLVYAEGRYLAPFIVLLWTALIMAMRLRPAPEQQPWLRGAGIVAIISLAVSIGTYHLDGFNALVRLVPVAKRGPVSGTAGVTASPVRVASGLRELGLREGESIGVIGDAITATWARLARVQIVADVASRDLEAFWKSSPAEQDAVLAAFGTAGARAVIAEAPAGSNIPPGWAQVGRTPYRVRFSPFGEGSTTPRAETR